MLRIIIFIIFVWSIQGQNLRRELPKKTDSTAKGGGGGKGKPGGGGGGEDTPAPAPAPAPGPTPSGRLLWSIKYSDSYGSTARPKIDSQGHIYVHSEKNIAAIVPSNPPQLKWSASAGTSYYHGVAVGNGKVYTANWMSPGNLYAFDSASGIEAYTTNVKLHSILSPETLDVAVGPDGSVYWLSAGPGIAKFTENTDNGNSASEDWYVSEPGEKSSPHVTEARFSSFGDRLYYHNVHSKVRDTSDGRLVYDDSGTNIGMKPVPFEDSYWVARSGFGSNMTRLRDDTVLCDYTFAPGYGGIEPVVGQSTGTAYTVVNGVTLFAIGPDCRKKYDKQHSDIFGGLNVDPQENVIVGYAGSGASELRPSTVIGFNPSNGREIFRESMPSGHFFASAGAFSQDGSVFYFTSYIHGTAYNSSPKSLILWKVSPAPILLAGAATALTLSSILALVWPTGTLDSIPVEGLKENPGLFVFVWLYSLLFWLFQDILKVLAFKWMKAVNFANINQTGVVELPEGAKRIVEDFEAEMEESADHRKAGKTALETVKEYAEENV